MIKDWILHKKLSWRLFTSSFIQTNNLFTEKVRYHSTIWYSFGIFHGFQILEKRDFFFIKIKSQLSCDSWSIQWILGKKHKIQYVWKWVRINIFSVKIQIFLTNHNCLLFRPSFGAFGGLIVFLVNLARLNLLKINTAIELEQKFKFRIFRHSMLIARNNRLLSPYPNFGS